MSEARWFLAHTKQDNDSDIDSWCQHLTDLLATEGWTTIVTPGRDDYSARARAMGGWNQWQTDVPQAETFMGEPMFHGIIVPADARGSSREVNTYSLGAPPTMSSGT